MMSLSLAVFGGQPVPADGAKRSEMLSQINAAAAAMTSMECRFVQTKTLKMLNDKMVSEGLMCYRQSDRLRWEYQTPYTYVFVLNGKRVLLDTGKEKNIIDVKTNRMFEEIARMMMDSVTGKCLSDASEFDVKLYTQGTGWIADLTPKKKQMRQMFVKIRLRFDTKAKVVDRVEMTDKSGDNTVIELKNIRKNKPVDERMFKID